MHPFMIPPSWQSLVSRGEVLTESRWRLASCREMDDQETASRLACWEAGTYGIHLSRWEPDEMRDLGYEVLFNPTYHRRPDRTFGAMFCWKTLTQADAL